MRFVVLGPLEVDDGGRPIALGGPKQRALLAVLLLRANETVSRDRLIDDLWGERPPANPGPTLDTYISRLRKQLGRERLLRRGGGYVLRVDPGELDLERFERLAAAGSYREALEAWRGPALADLLNEPFAAAEAERLEERRLAVLEERIDSDLADGAGVELVPEIERLVHEQPLRERLVGQLMVALYRAGLQTAALEVYGAARHRLAEGLGLEPGPQLKDLERRILNHDPSLAPPRRTSALRRRSHRPTRRQAALLMAGGVMVIGALVGGLVLGTTAPTARALPPSPRVIARIIIGRYNPATYQTGGGPLAVGAGAVWAISDASSTLMKIDPARNRIVKRIPVETPAAIAAGDDGVWLSNPSSGTVSRLNPAATTKTTIRVGPTPGGIAVSLGAVWVANAGLLPACRPSVSRINPATNQVVKTIPIPSKDLGCAAQTNLIASPGAVWVALSNRKSLVRINPATNKVVATPPVGFLACGALAADQTGIWVAATTCAGIGDGQPAGANPGSAWPNALAQIDARTNTLSPTKVAEADPAGVAVAFGSVWVTGAGNVDRINPNSGRRVARVHVSGFPDQLGAGFGSLWVNDDAGRVLRIKPQS